MPKRINFINRKRLPQYHSIEGVFQTVQKVLGKDHLCMWTELKHSGASPLVLLKNLISLKRKNNVIYHITGDVHYMALVLRGQAILTIHDVGSALKGSFFRRVYIRLFWFYLPALFVRDITVISDFTKAELSVIIPRFKHKISVVANPLNPIFKANHKTFNTVKPLILLIGTKANKNLERTLEALQDISCKLLIIGELSLAQKTTLDTFYFDYTNRVNLSNAEVYDCYKTCDLLCFASLYEGFGMPIIEAQATGRPVITSNIGAMQDVAGKAAITIDPYDVNAIRKAIVTLITDAKLRDELVIKGFKNVNRFTVDQISKAYNAIYNTF